MANPVQSNPGQIKKIPPLVADLCLLFVALGWGSTFIVVKTAVQELPPFPFLAIRFALAFLPLLPFLWLKRGYFNKSVLVKGILVGIFLFLGYITQTIGLQYTTASNAGFITGLNVVIVPMLLALYHKKAPRSSVIAGSLLAALGLALLSLGDNFSVNFGDPIVLICAFCFAIQIILVGRYAREVDTTVFTAVQVITVSVLCGLCSLVIPQPPVVFSAYVWFGLIVTALICTTLAFAIQNKMQQFTSPSHTAIIFSAEPVFAAIFAYLLAGELLSTRGYLGAACVLAGILIAELSSIKKPALEKGR